MTVFVAGGSGAIGVPLVRALVSAGHRVVATTRTAEKLARLRALGATPVVVDALDADALERAVRLMESQVLDAARAGTLEGLVLWYGLFYGPDSPATQEMVALVRRRRLPVIRRDRAALPFIHIDDAVTATVAALDRGSSGSVYDIVDDHPASFSHVVDEMAAIACAPRPLAVPAWMLRLIMPYMARTVALRPSLSKVADCSAVGVKQVLRTMVASSAISVPKLCAGVLSSSSCVAALRS